MTELEDLRAENAGLRKALAEAREGLAAANPYWRIRSDRHEAERDALQATLARVTRERDRLQGRIDRVLSRHDQLGTLCTADEHDLRSSQTGRTVVVNLAMPRDTGRVLRKALVEYARRTAAPPRVWAMPEIPEDVKAIRDRDGRRWTRCTDQPALWCYVSRTLEHAHLVGAELLTSHGPLAEVVEPDGD